MGCWKPEGVVGFEPEQTRQESSYLRTMSGMSTNAKRALVGAGLALALCYMIYLTMSVNNVTCEVCVEFRGVTECRKATAASRQEAEEAAASTACGLLAGGITDTLACQNTTPNRVSCQER